MSDKSQQAHELEDFISRTLAYGVVASAIILIVGVVLMLIEGSTGYFCSLNDLSCLLKGGNQSYPTSLQTLLSGLLVGRPFAVMELGVIALIATPVTRVAASIALFAHQKDRVFVLITIFVLFVLFFSFFAVPLIPLFRA